MDIVLEWDEAKCIKTLHERGLDFADLTSFDWEGGIFFDDKCFDYGEHRQSAPVLLNGQLVAIVFTIRGKKYHIISLAQDK